MSYKIEKGIRPVKDGRSGNIRYPFRAMKVGDSFFVPIAEANEGSMRMSPYAFSKRNPEYKFSIRKLKDGYRVWRVSVNDKKVKP